MTDDWQIKFCDFGRARYNDKGDKLKTQTLDSGIENVAYTAPEVYTFSFRNKRTCSFVLVLRSIWMVCTLKRRMCTAWALFCGKLQCVY